MASTPRSTEAFQAFGSNGISIAIADNALIVRIPMDDKARTASPLSSTGKSKLLANSGGFQMVPGTNIKLNVTASIPK